MITKQQYHRPQFAPDWAKTPTPPPTMIGTSETGEPIISSIDLAVGLGVKHRNLIETTRKYINDVLQFGQSPFKTATVTNSVGAVNETVTAYYNENQALFVGSLSRNTVQVVAFKVTLVREFDQARKALAEKNSPALIRQEALVKLVNDLQQDLIATKTTLSGLSGKLDRLNKSREKFYTAKVVQKKAAHEKEEADAAKKQRADLFNLLDRYLKVHTFESGTAIVEKIIDKVIEYYKVDLRRPERKTGEHYFDIAIRHKVAYCVEEVIRYHMFKSAQLK